MKNLKKLRETKNMSQQDLADKLFLTQQSVYKYENNLSYPNVETLKMMSELFNVSIDYIVDNHLHTHDKPTIEHEPISSDEYTIIKQIRNLSPKLRQDLIQLINDLS